MLTVEMLRQSQALAGLTDAQFNAIAEMSQNDENATIGNKIGELHGRYDTDVLSATGIKKNDGEKSYDYVKRVLGQYKAELDGVKTIKTQLDAANSKIAELQGKLENNTGDEVLRQQLKDTKNQVTQLQSKLTAKENELSKKESEYKKGLIDVRFNYAFDNAVEGLKFKDGITEPIKKVLINSARAEVLAKGTPDYVELNGKQQLVFRDAAGQIITNSRTNLNPYTVKELVMETSLKDAMAEVRRVPGGGTGPNFEGKGGKGTVTLDLSEARTQVEADKIIENYLLASGITRDSADFSAQSLQIRNDNNVSQLPLR